jgi:flagellar FliJ protein
MFKSPLEPVLKHRKFIEENLQKELAAIEKSLVIETQKLQEYRSSICQLSADLKQRQKEGSPVSEIFLFLGFIEQQSKDIRNQEKHVSEIRKRMELKRRDLVEATKKRRTLEKLKEKQLRSHKQVLQKKEQVFLDEMGISQFNKKTG